MKYFTDEEVKCNCGCNYMVNNEELFTMIDEARRRAGIPFVVNSWCRCKFHNKSIGGSPTSSHLVGDAIDIKFTGWQNLGIMLKALYSCGFDRILIYPEDMFIHVDIAPDKMKPITKIMKD
jgi:uncharacterized protein YcbK (DUF882 family)